MIISILSANAWILKALPYVSLLRVFLKIFVFTMYVGESKIIRTIGTCFAVGFTAGWPCQNTKVCSSPTIAVQVSP